MSDLLWEIAEYDDKILSQLIGDFGLTRLSAMVLANRGTALDQVEQFLRPKLRSLVDPYIFPGLEKAAARIWQAVTNGEKIVIHGDYDTDGVTSSALIAWVLRESGGDVTCFVPHRLEDGYGLTPSSVVKISVSNPKLLITVDCGINSCDATAKATELGIDVIITDHHEPREVLPAAYAVINPKLTDNVNNLHDLAGVGVTFKVCHAFLKYGRDHSIGGMSVDLKDGLDLVALGTVADIVPLLGENRCLVKHGMRVLSAQRRPGIRALCEISRLQHDIKPSDITYRLAPRLNAAGRMGDATDAMHLLQCENIVEAYSLANKLDECNKRRQAQERETLASAMQQIETENLAERTTIVVYGHGWHLGVVGIVASRLVQSYRRPCVVLSINSDGVVHGSGRSVDGVNLVQALDSCSAHLDRYGGHPMASGLTLAEGNLPAFRKAFEARFDGLCNGSTESFRPRLKIDGDASLAQLDDNFFAELEDLQPFGHSHPAPRFRFQRVRCDRLQRAGDSNTRGTMYDDSGAQMPFIAFGREPRDFPDGPWDVAACPELNEHNNNVYPQIQIQAVQSV
jgi:single-stranded-DNA-specific exonuclease